MPGKKLSVTQPTVIEYLASCTRAARVRQAMPGVDAIVVGPTTVAAKCHMYKSISEYNAWVTHATSRIDGKHQTVLIALCEATPTTISLLEDHYSTVRHTEGALTLEQLGYCDLSVGISRIPNVKLNVPAIWKAIMNVSLEVIEEFVRNLGMLCSLLAGIVQYLGVLCSSVLAGWHCMARCGEPFWTSTAR
jgi:hypothetical protein